MRPNETEYFTWHRMMQRCYNENCPVYDDYGGRGIKVCDRWRDRAVGFTRFLKDMGQRPPNMTLDRVNNDGNYEPSNCRWATRTQQQRNRRSYPRRKRTKRP